MWDECMLFYLKKKRKILSHLTTPRLYMSMWAGWGVSKVVNLSSKTSFSPKKSANLSDIWPHPGPTCPCGRRSHVCHVSGGGPWYTRVNDKTGNVQILGGNNICPRFKRNWSTHVYYNTLHSEATHASPLIFALAHDSRLTRLGCDWKKALWRDWPIYLHWAQNLISVLNRVLFCRVCVCSARCEGPTPQRGHDGRRLNQQNLYLLLITFAKCQPDTRSAILRVWVIAAAITGTTTTFSFEPVEDILRAITCHGEIQYLRNTAWRAECRRNWVVSATATLLQMTLMYWSTPNVPLKSPSERFRRS